MEDKFRFLKSKILSGRVYPEFFPFNLNDIVINVGCGKGPQAIIYSGQYKEMIGIDINKKRLQKSKEAMKIYGVKNYKTLYANVEKIPLPSNKFDKAIAIDIIEHVQNPRKLVLEVNRLLKENRKLLITFPAMHDKFTKIVSGIGCFILRRKKKEVQTKEWDPDIHNQDYKIKEWIKIVESCGFKLQKSKASTLFPPLHLYGIPKFWFSNNIIHKIDGFLCRLPIVKKYGQSLMCIFIKKGS